MKSTKPATVTQSDKMDPFIWFMNDFVPSHMTQIAGLFADVFSLVLGPFLQPWIKDLGEAAITFLGSLVFIGSTAIEIFQGLVSGNLQEILAGVISAAGQVWNIFFGTV
jgi:hypothetical protein